MGGRQMELITAGTMTELLDVLSAKQRLLGRLEKIERASGPVSRPGRRPSVSGRAKTAAGSAPGSSTQCESLLAEIAAARSRRASASWCAAATRRRRSFEGVQQAIRARGAYAAQPQRRRPARPASEA